MALAVTRVLDGCTGAAEGGGVESVEGGVESAVGCGTESALGGDTDGTVEGFDADGVTSEVSSDCILNSVRSSQRSFHSFVLS